MQQTHPFNSAGNIPGSRPANQLRTVVRAILPCANHCPKNRHRAQELAWEWVGAKWPRLLPSPRDMVQSHVERSMNDHELRVSTSKDGTSWTLSVAHAERRSRRIWTTRVQVADTGHADTVGVQTSCSDVDDAALVVAPPRVLGAWVENLALHDGGFAVLCEPRSVSQLSQLDVFCAHVLSARRRLPIIALTHRAQSRHYGVDPGGLALAVRGLAHVACLAPEVAAALPAVLGQGSGLVHGTARIFAPGFHARAVDDRQPLLRDPHVPGSRPTDDPGAFRRKLSRHVCAMGVRIFMG